MSAQPLLGEALAETLMGKGPNSTDSSVLQCWLCFQLCTGQEDQSSHQSTARALCQSSVLNGCQAGPFLWHCRGGYCYSSLALISRNRRRNLVSHTPAQSQASTLQQSSLRLSRMISDKTGELKLPYVWFWIASLRFMCCKNGQVAIRSSLSLHKVWSHEQDAFLGCSWCLICAMPWTAALINLQNFYSLWPCWDCKWLAK